MKQLEITLLDIITDNLIQLQEIPLSYAIQRQQLRNEIADSIGALYQCIIAAYKEGLENG